MSVTTYIGGGPPPIIHEGDQVDLERMTGRAYQAVLDIHGAPVRIEVYEQLSTRTRESIRAALAAKIEEWNQERDDCVSAAANVQYWESQMTCRTDHGEPSVIGKLFGKERYFTTITRYTHASGNLLR